MKRLALVTTAAVAAATISFASAASLGGLDSAAVAAGEASVDVCDANGFSVDYSTVGGNVTAATAGDIADPGCEGADLSITVTNGAGQSIASGGPVSIGADGDTSPNAVTVAVSPQPAAEQVAGVHVAVVGP